MNSKIQSLEHDSSDTTLPPGYDLLKVHVRFIPCVVEIIVGLGVACWVLPRTYSFGSCAFR